MRVKLRYRGHAYQLEGTSWRGPDGHIVHLLTWITDDLVQQLPASDARDEAAVARQVAERLGEEARVFFEPDPAGSD